MKKWKIYEGKKRQEEGEKCAPGVLILPHENFKVLEFSILPSIDEKDRERSVAQRLEERFLDTKELPFLYFELLSQDEEEEKIFCSYLKDEVQGEDIPSYIDFLIPSFLLGKCLSVKENYFLVEYSRKGILFFVYAEGKIHFFQKIENGENAGIFDLIFQKNILKEEGKKKSVLLTGEYTQEDFLYWEEKFPVLSIQKLKINKIPKEIDIFHHGRLTRGGGRSKNVISMGILFVLVGIIFLGFYFQYQLEENKMILAELEEENKGLEVDTRKLEEKIADLQDEGEEEQEKILKKEKIIEDLEKIYFLASTLEIVALEYLETGMFKLQILSGSTREYTNLIREILSAKFQFVNHDYIEREQATYKVELEIKKVEV